MRAVMFMLLPAIVAVAGAIAAEPDPQVEMKYADGLMKMGLDEYAVNVLKALPETNNTAIVLAKFQVELMQPKLDEDAIERYITKRAEKNSELYWVMKIRLADTLWARGEQKKCTAIYEAFVKYYSDTFNKDKQPAKAPPGQVG